jgi:heme o synthase
LILKEITVTPYHSFVSDIFALTKPKITLMAVFLAMAGLLHAGSQVHYVGAIISLVGISLLVSGSSALNMYIERDLDKKMVRTKDRPLPAGRLNPAWAMIIGTLCSLMAFGFFYMTGNYLTLWLGIVAFSLYVFCYTPLKQKSWVALLVGSIPGAMPVVLGYTSLAQVVDGKAWALFLWAFLWQIPHFLAISLFREQEYTEAGFPVLSKIAHEVFAKKVLLFCSWLLVLSTLGLFLSGVIGAFNLAICLCMGLVFLYVCHQGAFSNDTHAWARRAFRASLVYQGLLFIALVIGAFL